MKRHPIESPLFSLKSDGRKIIASTRKKAVEISGLQVQLVGDFVRHLKYFGIKGKF